MQNLGNILILRGEIVIMPPDRRSVSYEYLSALLGDRLVNKSSDIDLDSVFSVLPKTQRERFDDYLWTFLTASLRWARPKSTVYRYIFFQASWSWR